MLVLKDDSVLSLKLLPILLILYLLINSNCSNSKIIPEPPIQRSGTISELSDVNSDFALQAKDLDDGTIFFINITDTTIITTRTLNNPPPGPTLTRSFDPERKQIVRQITMPNGKTWIDEIFVEGKTSPEIYDIKKCVEWEHLGEMFEFTNDSSLLKLQILYDSCD